MSQAAVADRERLPPELGKHCADDACAGENDLGTIGLQADDLPALLGARGAVELDLPVDVGSVEDGAVNEARFVGGESQLDRGEIRDGSPHADEAVGPRPAVEAL